MRKTFKQSIKHLRWSRLELKMKGALRWPVSPLERFGLWDPSTSMMIVVSHEYRGAIKDLLVWKKLPLYRTLAKEGLLIWVSCCFLFLYIPILS